MVLFTTTHKSVYNNALLKIIKNMKNKSIKIVILIVIIVLATLLLVTKNNPPKDVGLKIGVIAPLSGNLSMFGQDFINGANLAISEISGQPDQAKKITLKSEDDQFDPKKSVSSYYNLKNTFKPNVIITFGNSADETLLPIITKDKIFSLSTFSTASRSKNDSNIAFRYFTNADIDAPLSADFAFSKLGLRNIAILYVQDNFGVDYNRIYSSKIKELGGNITISEQISYTQNDYRTELTKIIATHPDGVYLVGQDFQIIIAARGLRDLGYKGKIMSVGTIATSYSIGQANGVLEGVYTTAFCTDGTPESFVKKFKETYNTKPGFMAELGYDSIRIIAKASDNGKDTDSKEIGNNMMKIKDFETNQGLVSANSKGEIIIPLCPKVIKDNKIFNLITNKYSNY